LRRDFPRPVGGEIHEIRSAFCEVYLTKTWNARLYPQFVSQKRDNFIRSQGDVELGGVVSPIDLISFIAMDSAAPSSETVSLGNIFDFCPCDTKAQEKQRGNRLINMRE
jgi:hypothetical protein